MARNNYLTSPEITEYTIEGGIGKVNRTFLAVLLMGILAGLYIALGAIASSTAAHNISNVGLTKLVTGAVFPVGLMFVVLNGADLFTGNCLIVMAVYEKKVTAYEFLKNLSIVLLGNFIGAVFMAFLQAYSGLFTMSDGAFAYYVFKTAHGKVTLPFFEALILGIICNIFVCAGIVMVYSAKDTAGKILAGFFSIFAFAISASEHIVANMYYVPTAIFAKYQPHLVDMAIEAGYYADKLADITWKNFLLNNALPVGIGNIIGGVIIGTLYYLIHKVYTKPY
ncbi:MAG: FdhC protein [Epulopiscium sp. Nuni2H_MBin001]|nr:MAG: FdhC protein [Epulopiscium sp. Nuni2H_MBin001]